MKNGNTIDPKYNIDYWFEHGGGCLWPLNENTKKRFGYPVNYHKLPISKELTEELDSLEVEYKGFLNWDDPISPSPWTEEQKSDFKKRANEVYQKLTSELSCEFEVINSIDGCLREE